METQLKEALDSIRRLKKESDNAKKDNIQI